MGESRLTARLVVDPDDGPQTAELLAAVSAPAAGRAVCELTPGRATLSRLALSMLEGLGKRIGTTGAAGSSSEAWRRVRAWYSGEEIAHIFVARAQLRPPSDWRRLVELA